mmetsp:Transcript_23162/g.32310  ORF Transcript_23162/g.32310 Transcript_23162/m.32310 type:complete len:218 (+) Transcript_23162:320-973(+)
MSFHIDTDSTGALVQDCKLRFVIKQSSHGNSLFFSTRQDIFPIVSGVPASFSVNDVLEANSFEDHRKIFISNSLSSSISHAVWINNLVSKSAQRKVRSLRNVENIGSGWLGDSSLIHRPESSQNSEQAALSASIRSSNKKVLSNVKCESESFDKKVSVRAVDTQIVHNNALNIVSFHNSSFLLGLQLSRVTLDVSFILHVFKDFKHLAYSVSIASQL